TSTRPSPECTLSRSNRPFTATRAWMVAFHEARDRFSGDAARAAREAMRSVRRARLARGEPDSPFYWAAFTAQGR
ncbi:MAG: CHAT domain-containing protein, partial [Candidatus Eisenbacteria bacterium]|nr:CHAT domain-containing protein [Candidatus Eisenbacteria bacterium]